MKSKIITNRNLNRRLGISKNVFTPLVLVMVVIICINGCGLDSTQHESTQQPVKAVKTFPVFDYNKWKESSRIFDENYENRKAVATNINSGFEEKVEYIARVVPEFRVPEQANDPWPINWTLNMFGPNEWWKEANRDSWWETPDPNRKRRLIVTFRNVNPEKESLKIDFSMLLFRALERDNAKCKTYEVNDYVIKDTIQMGNYSVKLRYGEVAQVVLPANHYCSVENIYYNFTEICTPGEIDRRPTFIEEKKFKARCEINNWECNDEFEWSDHINKPGWQTSDFRCMEYETKCEEGYNRYVEVWPGTTYGVEQCENGTYWGTLPFCKPLKWDYWDNLKAMVKHDGHFYIVNEVNNHNYLFKVSPVDGTSYFHWEMSSGTQAMTTSNNMLYIVKNDRLHIVSPKDGSLVKTLGGATWNNVKVIAEHDSVLYMVKGDYMYAVSPFDGSSRKLHFPDWGGTTSMIELNGKLWAVRKYGSKHYLQEVTVGNSRATIKRLLVGPAYLAKLNDKIYIIQNQLLYRLQLTGSGTKLELIGSSSPFWSGTQAMSSHDGYLYIVKDGILRRVSPIDGSVKVLGKSRWCP